MFYKRPSLRRGGMPTGIETIGGGKIAGSNLGSRTGFNELSLISGGMQNELTGGSNFKKPRTYSSRIGPTRTPFQARFPLFSSTTSAMSVPSFSTAATLAAPFIPTGIMAYANRPRTTEALKVMKSEPSSTFDETAIPTMDGELGEYDKFLKEMKDANQKGEPISFLDAFLMDPESGTYPKFAGRTKDRDIKKEIEKAEEKNKNSGFLPNAGPKQVNFDDIANDVVTNKNTSEDTPKEFSFDDTYQTEFNRLEKLVGGKENEKGMLAIALSDAIGTEGTIADKAATLNKSLLKIVGDRKSNRRDIAKTAYAATKAIEAAKIKAGTVSDSQKNLNRAERLVSIISNPNSSKADIASAKKELSNLTQAVSIFSKKDTSLSSTDKTLAESFNKLAIRLSGIEDKNSEIYKKTYKRYLQARELASRVPELSQSIILNDALAGITVKKDGGRIGYSMGTPDPMSKEMSNVPAEPVEQNLSFEELRSRLPKEITDDVIKIISGSSQALQDFAYIRTQGDVNKFNMKYGVNLVLPAQA